MQHYLPFCVLFADLMKWTRLKTPNASDDDYDCIPYMRYGHTASTLGDKIYIFGGCNEERGACNRLYCFDISKFDNFVILS